MKQKINNWDIFFICNELKNLINNRIQNIYDYDTKSIYLKFSGNEKKYLLLNPLISLFLLNKSPKKLKNIPSGFTAKLRKHLNNKRLINVEQIAFDRVICFSFGLSEIYYHLYIEFFANGNIILTDNQNKIIISQRYFKYDDNNIVFKEHIYQTNFENIPNKCIDNTINLKEEFKILGTECINTIFVENIELNNENILKKIDEIKNSPKFTIYSKKSINELFLSFHSNFYDNLYENNLYDNKTIYTNIFDCLNEYFKDKIIYQEELNKNLEKKFEIRKREKNPLKNLELQENEYERILNNINLIIENCYIEQKLSEYYEFKVKRKEKRKIEMDNNKSFGKNIEKLYLFQKEIRNKLNMTKKIMNDFLIINIVNKKKNDDFFNNKNKNLENNILNKFTQRKEYWFEKYNWTITSNGLIFICGKNIDQNEEIVKKYLDKNDIYVHGDFHGSPSGILKTNNNNQISIKILEECGNFLLCMSRIWTEKGIERCYWVYENQVSKTPESGEYLVKGSFMIRGEKNYLSLNPLSLGITFVKNFSLNSLNTLIQENIISENDSIFILIGPYNRINKFNFRIKLEQGTQKGKKQLELVRECVFKNKYLNDLTKNILIKILKLEIENRISNKFVIKS
jgi:predicted ribosome quality control (RQC) complex YloA/Tae2 family protein